MLQPVYPRRNYRALFRRRRRMRRGGVRGEAGAPLFLVGRTDVANRGARGVHLHRVTRDIYADGSSNAVGFPLHDVAVLCPSRDEAIFVAVVPAALAPAIARHVAEYFRMLRSECVDGTNDFHRPRGRSRNERKRRQVLLWMGLQCDGGRQVGGRRRLRRSETRFRPTRSAVEKDSRTRDDNHECNDENRSEPASASGRWRWRNGRSRLRFGR